MAVELHTVIKCPACGYFQMEEMPDAVLVLWWQCPGCGEIVRPAADQCCAYCSFASNKCPTAQRLDAANASFVVLDEGAARKGSR